MSTGIQPFLPVGPDGLPMNLTGGGSGTGGGGTGSNGAVNVNVVNQQASVVRQVTLNLATARTAEPLSLSPMKVIYAFTVRRLEGDAGSFRIHINGGEGLAVDEGEARDGLSVPGLAATNSAATGSVQLEIYGG